MRKSFFAAAAAGALSLGLMAPAFAGPGDPGNPSPGATVTQDEGCVHTSHGADGAGTLFTNDSQFVTSPQGNSKITCHFTYDLAYAPDKAVVITGFLCGTPGGWSDQSHSVTRPNGTITLTCHYKA